MNYTLKATQCLTSGKLYLNGTVTAPVAGYVVDSLSLSFMTVGEKAALVMDLFPPAGGGLRSITGGECPVKIDLNFNAMKFIKTLMVYLHGETIELQVTQLKTPEPTD